jgi:hypothetical protein
MDLDDVTLELRTREQVYVRLSEFPLLESDEERAKAARRLIRHAAKEIGARVQTVYLKHAGKVAGVVDREHSDDELHELMELAAHVAEAPESALLHRCWGTSRSAFHSIQATLVRAFPQPSTYFDRAEHPDPVRMASPSEMKLPISGEPPRTCRWRRDRRTVNNAARIGDHARPGEC